jgi:son of sevenless
VRPYITPIRLAFPSSVRLCCILESYKLFIFLTSDHSLVGVYLTDLTFIEDGIPSHTPSDLINFNKRTKTAEVIRDIQQYQNVPYLLQPVSELQDFILSHMQSASDVHEMYERSLEVEPRERDDEKIARYALAKRPSNFSDM